MNRREFLKSALTIAALAPVTRLAAGGRSRRRQNIRCGRRDAGYPPPL